jgi:hypothetical protein
MRTWEESMVARWGFGLSGDQIERLQALDRLLDYFKWDPTPKSDASILPSPDVK